MISWEKYRKGMVIGCIAIGVMMLSSGCQTTPVSEVPAVEATENTTDAATSPVVEPNPLDKGYQTIDGNTGKTMMDNQEVILLDVRTQEEFNEGHIEKALLLPVDELESKASDLLPNKEATIIVYCRSGNRSATASELLVSLGYSSVYDMGGIIDWPFDVVKP